MQKLAEARKSKTDNMRSKLESRTHAEAGTRLIWWYVCSSCIEAVASIDATNKQQRPNMRQRRALAPLATT